MSQEELKAEKPKKKEYGGKLDNDNVDGFNLAIDKYEAYEATRHQEFREIDKDKLRDIILDGFVELVDHCNDLETIKPYGVPNDITARLVDRISQTFCTPKELSEDELCRIIDTYYILPKERIGESALMYLVDSLKLNQREDVIKLAKAILNHKSQGGKKWIK